MKGTIHTVDGNKDIESCSPWKDFEKWGGCSWFTSHEEEEAKETVEDEHAERFADIEPRNVKKNVKDCLQNR